MAVVDSFSNDDNITQRNKQMETINNDDPPPPRPDISGLSEEDATSQLLHWQKQCKSWCDWRRKLCLANEKFDKDDQVYSGDHTAVLRTMENVELRHLHERDNFRSKEVVQLPVAEEANSSEVVI